MLVSRSARRVSGDFKTISCMLVSGSSVSPDTTNIHEMVLKSLARGFEINGNVYTWLCVGSINYQ